MEKYRTKIEMAIITLAVAGMVCGVIMLVMVLCSRPVPGPNDAINLRPECQRQAMQWINGERGE